MSDKRWYQPKRDGSIGDFLSKHKNSRAIPTFLGYESYQILWKEGYLEPKVSAIRLMWNVGREDEYFLVMNDEILSGIQLPAHSGAPGRHSARETLSQGIPWEAHYLSLNPTPQPLTQPNLPFPTQ